MSATTTPTIGTVLEDVRAFLQGLLPDGTPVIKGVVNRVPVPLPNTGFVVMTPIRQERLRTNLDFWDMVNPNPTQKTMEQGTRLDLQLDFYGPTSGNWAAAVSTAWRDGYGFDTLIPSCAPLYIDEVQMVPLVDSEQQYEIRWSTTAVLQWNPVTTIDQQFANSLNLNLVDVDVEYPA